jgi:hypothetical protein
MTCNAMDILVARVSWVREYGWQKAYFESDGNAMQ